MIELVSRIRTFCCSEPLKFLLVIKIESDGRLRDDPTTRTKYALMSGDGKSIFIKNLAVLRTETMDRIRPGLQ